MDVKMKSITPGPLCCSWEHLDQGGTRQGQGGPQPPLSLPCQQFRAWFPQLCARVGWWVQLAEGLTFPERFRGKPCRISWNWFNVTNKRFWDWLEVFVVLLLLFYWSELQTTVFFFLPHSNTLYIGPFFFLPKEDTWIISLKRRWWGSVVTGHACPAVCRRVWSEWDQRSAQLSYKEWEAEILSKNLGSILDSRGQRGIGGSRRHSSSKHHASLVVKTDDVKQVLLFSCVQLRGSVLKGLVLETDVTNRCGGKWCSYCIQALANSLYIPICLKQNQMGCEAPGLIWSPYWILWMCIRNCSFTPEGRWKHIRQTMSWARLTFYFFYYMQVSVETVKIPICFHSVLV